MTLQVETDSVQAKLPEMLAAAKNGDEVLIVENNRPIAQLITVKADEPWTPPKSGRKAGSMKGKIWIADDFDAPLEEFKDYM